MRFLIDTNILIPLEPVRTTDFEINSRQACLFLRTAHETKQAILVHPYIQYDLKRDKDEERRKVREFELDKYHKIESISVLRQEIASNWPEEVGSNGWVDNHLLNSLLLNSCDHLVTEDGGIHKKARQLGLEERVLTLEDAIDVLEGLFPKKGKGLPLVREEYCYKLDRQDPIFKSLRNDYIGFDLWFEQKCCRQARRAWIIEVDKGKGGMTGLCIFNEESRVENGPIGKTLKLCTFKISDGHARNRYGELLLKKVFCYAYDNDYDYLYMTIFPNKQVLVGFVQDFGFEIVGFKGEELVLCKSMKMPEFRSLGNFFQHHVKYGPRLFQLKPKHLFIVPIMPGYHDILYPERQENLNLFPPDTCGNSLRKAYLSHANTKQICQGDTLLFYQSQIKKEITSIGVVEKVRRENDVSQILMMVAKRTVYTMSEIEDACSDGRKVLVILYRDAGELVTPIPFGALLKSRIINGPIQSIVMLKEVWKCRWLQEKIKL